MKKIGPKGMKWLKIIHVFLVVLFFGGILSSLALNLHIDFTKYDESYLGYKNIIIISDNIVRWGAIGTLLVGFTYGFFTNWGFFKHRWVGVKFVLYIDSNNHWYFCCRQVNDSKYGIIGNSKRNGIK